MKAHSIIRLVGALVCAAVLHVSTANAWTERVLYAFTGGSDGAIPRAGLIRDSAGNLYGTTVGIGLINGTVFKLAPDGTFTTLHSFMSGGSYAGVIRDSAGNLYGTDGDVFKLAPDGTFTTLHSFMGGSDGDFAYAGVIRDSAGNLYGTTVYGGSNDCGQSGGCGTVFKLAPDGTETVLHAFAGGNDGAFPYAGVIRDSAGSLYGTTRLGGEDQPACVGGISGCGTVYKIGPDGKETVLLSFRPAGNHGTEPMGGVIRDSAGKVYGTTYGGGFYGYGTVFELGPEGHERVLYSFRGARDGASPYAGVIMDSAGNLYGTTLEGGASEVGIVFRLSTDGSKTTLHSFTGGNDGANPTSGLIADKRGDLYGTTTAGGNYCAPPGYSCGTVFSVTP